MSSSFPILTAEEAIRDIHHGDTVAFSGFTPAGAAKAVPRALAARARAAALQGAPFKLRVLTGASSGQAIDEELAAAGAIMWRAPYQTGSALRKQINAGDVEYVDMHLSHVPQAVGFGFFGPIDVAVVEATEVTPDGRVYLSTSIGASPTYLSCARKVIVEVNRRHARLDICRAGSSAELAKLLHHDPAALDFVQAKPDRCGRLSQCLPFQFNHLMPGIGAGWHLINAKSFAWPVSWHLGFGGGRSLGRGRY